MLEREIEAKLVKFCRENGIYTRKFTSPSNRGVPDRVLIKHGKVLFLELKREGERPTKLQMHEIALIRGHHGNAEWADGWQRVKDTVVSFFNLDSGFSDIS